MALPVEIGQAQAESIRRAVVVLALWEARREVLRHVGGPALLREAEDALALDPPEREAIALYEASTGRFSFFDRRAANWLFGHVVAAIVDQSGDFAVVAPAAAWAIHALNATDQTCREMSR